MSITAKANYIDANGALQEVELNTRLYEQAMHNRTNLKNMLNSTYRTRAGDPSAFDQFAINAGLFFTTDVANGIKSPSMDEVINGPVTINAGSITRGTPDGSTPASRILFPEAIMRAVESQLMESDDPFLSGVNKMIAVNASVDSPMVSQPVIDSTAPGEISHEPIAQGALPRNMVTISTSDTYYRIPTHSVGLQITEEALQSSTLDLVGLALAANTRVQSILRVEQDLKAMIEGDADRGETRVESQNASIFDESVDVNNPITQKAWVKFLHQEYRKRTLDWLIMDIDTALGIENRANKPTVMTDNPNSSRIDTQFTIENLSLPTPNVLLVDSQIIGTNTIVGLDSRYAIRKTTNVSASYSAIEEFVMRKVTALRFDYGYTMKKLYKDAWTAMTLGQ